MKIRLEQISFNIKTLGQEIEILFSEKIGGESKHSMEKLDGGSKLLVKIFL
jgi:hypothetical protein